MLSVTPRPAPFPPQSQVSCPQGSVGRCGKVLPLHVHFLAGLLGGSSCKPSIFVRWMEVTRFSILPFTSSEVRECVSCPLSNFKFSLFLELPLRGRIKGKQAFVEAQLISLLAYSGIIWGAWPCVRGCWRGAGLLTPVFLWVNIRLILRQ